MDPDTDPADKSKGYHLAKFRWRPGQSGNPSGRPRSPDAVLAKARALAKDASVEALGTLVALMRAAPDQKLRAWCARQVWDMAGEVGTAKDPAAVVRERPVPASASELEALFERLGREALREVARAALAGEGNGPTGTVEAESLTPSQPAVEQATPPDEPERVSPQGGVP